MSKALFYEAKREQKGEGIKERKEKGPAYLMLLNHIQSTLIIADTFGASFCVHKMTRVHNASL